jgi:hypothetical protein
MEGNLMTTELLFWEPGQLQAQTRTVDSSAEVLAVAEPLLARYRAGGNSWPGLELRHNEDGPGLAIAASDRGWALIHTDDNLDQHRTAGNDPNAPDSVEIVWDEPTPIPASWFIPEALALAGVDQWLIDGGLASELVWSEDCA